MKYFDYLDNEEENKIKYDLENASPDVIHGIMVIGLDNFVIVNEMYGRRYGDQVLKQVSEIIHKMFRGTDIVLKLRGDEFIVYTKNISAINNIEILAQKILNSISAIQAKDTFYLSTSVGMSLYPLHAKDYSGLKNKAYQAMLRAKANGKNRYRLYDSARTKAIYHEYVFNKEECLKKLESDTYFTFDIMNRYEEICTYMFKEDKDPLSAMSSIMELSCQYLGFSRVYVYSVEGLSEREERKLSYAATGYEFGRISKARAAIRDDMHIRLKNQYNQYALIDTMDENLDEELRITFEDEGITQIFYYPTYKDGIFNGAFIFENLSNDLINFSHSELLNLNRQMQSIEAYYYLIKGKLRYRDILSKLEVFEGIDSFIYIIDTKTDIIIYANRKALLTSEYDVIGKKYKDVLLGMSAKDESWPFDKMDINSINSTASVDSFITSVRKWCRCQFLWLDTNENKGKAIAICQEIDDLVEMTNSLFN